MNIKRTLRFLINAQENLFHNLTDYIIALSDYGKRLDKYQMVGFEKQTPSKINHNVVNYSISEKEKKYY